MQHRSFRIDDILAEDTRPNETTKPEGKEETEVTVARRPPILLPRIEPIVWNPCMNNCCHSPSNCGRSKAYLPPWYDHRNPQGFPGNRIKKINHLLLFLSTQLYSCLYRPFVFVQFKVIS